MVCVPHQEEPRSSLHTVRPGTPTLSIRRFFAHDAAPPTSHGGSPPFSTWPEKPHNLTPPSCMPLAVTGSIMYPRTMITKS